MVARIVRIAGTLVFVALAVAQIAAAPVDTPANVKSQRFLLMVCAFGDDPDLPPAWLGETVTPKSMFDNGWQPEEASPGEYLFDSVDGIKCLTWFKTRDKATYRVFVGKDDDTVRKINLAWNPGKDAPAAALAFTIIYSNVRGRAISLLGVDPVYEQSKGKIPGGAWIFPTGAPDEAGLFTITRNTETGSVVLSVMLVRQSTLKRQG